jgi:hypothetical protein
MAKYTGSFLDLLKREDELLDELADIKDDLAELSDELDNTKGSELRHSVRKRIRAKEADEDSVATTLRYLRLEIADKIDEFIEIRNSLIRL